jgi:hypothetical protein
MKILVSVLLATISAILLAVLGGLVVGGGSQAGHVSLWLMLLGWIASLILFVMAPTVRRAAGRACLTIGLESFALPVAGMIFSMVVAAKSYPTSGSQAAQSGAALGAIIGGGAVTVALGIFGFFFGLFFVVAAYFLLKEPTTRGS